MLATSGGARMLDMFTHTMYHPRHFLRVLGAGAFFAQGMVFGQSSATTEQAVQALIEQNRILQEQVKEQQKTIEVLNGRMEEIRRASERHERELQSLQERTVAAPAERPVPVERDQEVRIGGEAGLAFFKTGSAGQFPRSEFRVDDTKITLEAAVWKNVYFFTELNLLSREANASDFYFGELYVDFEGLGSAWGRPDSLNVRAGSINIPFGEEYLVRGPIADPLISHSLSDLWGPDEGVEVYGKLGSWQYALALQNGGVSQLRDFNSDKSLTARLGWDPLTWLHLSASAMRTGEIATVSPVTSTGDSMTALWFAGAFFRALGPASTTATFWANLYEGDAVARWKSGQATLALGQVHFDDSDTAADNARRLHYGYLEAMQSITDHLYAAARYSEIQAPKGYPLAGWGNPGLYFYRPSLTEELRRVSLGFGYRFGPPLVLKLEYSWESGRMINGAPRDHENFLGGQIGLKF